MSSIEYLIKAFQDAYGDKVIHVVSQQIEQAKTLHKEEMGKTWDSALDAGQERAWNVMRAYADFDDYYNEKFNK